MNGTQARERIAQQDALTELLRNTSGKGPVGVCEPELEPLATVREVVIGDEVKVGNKSAFAQVRAVEINATAEIHFVKRGMDQPVDASDAAKILHGTQKGKLTRALHQETRRLSTKFTNATKR